MSTQEINQEPNWLQPKFENIPEELQKQPWAVWKAEQKFDRQGSPTGKWGKAPRNPTSGIMVGADKPHLFGTFKEAKKAYESGRYTGVGVLLTGNGIIGVDIDDAAELFKQKPHIKEWVRQAIKAGVYCEISPSNSGFRLFTHGCLDGRGRKDDRVEIYDDKRFLTVTGQVQHPKEAAL